MVDTTPMSPERYAQLDRETAKLLPHCKPTLLRVTQQSKRLVDPDPDSWLGRVDSLTTPLKLTAHIHALALIAAENLREVDRILSQRVPVFALYSMIRSAVEASSFALWLLDSRNEQLAASRILRIHRQNIEADRLLWLSTDVASTLHADVLAIAQDRHARLKGIHPDDFNKAVKSTPIIESVDRTHDLLYRKEGDLLHILTGLQIWRMCSAVAHGNTLSLESILESIPGEKQGEPASVKSRLMFLTSSYSSTLGRTNDAIDAYRKRSHPQRKGR
ncbi:hypothetical protein [Leucobacter tardus]|uniref:Uncharacterized protein n=1 Tax=Leucobacter tardus TaxID=501483 RepID=A0A939QJV6_9MICO|nr:hypothetical protein [Leucobacter tardus]MBO2989256.1 hypothetical protein [Leucobacter tardus]